MAEPDSLGGVSAEEVAALADVGVPSEAGASLTTRFSRRVSDLIAARQAHGEAGHYAVFLQSDEVIRHAAQCKHIESPLLSHGLDPVSNAVWLSTANLHLAFRLCLKWCDAASLFQAIRDAGLGDVPAIVVDFRASTPIGKLYRQGLSAAEMADDVSFDDMPITGDQMKKALDRFYESALRTPSLIVEGHAKRVWKEPVKGIPESRPEEVIQGRLLDNLRGIFAQHDLRAEPITDDGRADIVVSKKGLTRENIKATITEWILELKALADMTHTGNASTVNIPDAIESGLEQVIGYKTQLNAVRAALCCYDMRKDNGDDDACFMHIASHAVANEIALWRWFLFRSTSASRSAKGYLTTESA